MAATNRSILLRAALGATLLCGVAGSAHAGSPQEYSGVFALANTPAKSSAVLKVTPLGGNVEGLDFAFQPMGATGKTVTHFDATHEKQLHVVLVSADFHQFQHDHVETAGPNGHFRLKVTFPYPGVFHVYADAAPSGLGHQVFRFDLPVGVTSSNAPAPELHPSKLVSSCGSYEATLEQPKLIAGQEAALHIRITRDGKPATDLTPYLGAAAHAILISADTLAYVHAHAMGKASSGLEASDLMVHVTPPGHGLYKMWLQFDAGGKPQTVSFVLPVA